MDSPSTEAQFPKPDTDFVGSDQPNIIVGLDAADTIEGRKGDDTLLAGNGSDLLDGGDGDDQLYGGTDNTISVPDWHIEVPVVTNIKHFGGYIAHDRSLGPEIRYRQVQTRAATDPLLLRRGAVHPTARTPPRASFSHPPHAPFKTARLDHDAIQEGSPRT